MGIASFCLRMRVLLGTILPVYIGLTLRILNMVVMERAFWLVMVIVVT